MAALRLSPPLQKEDGNELGLVVEKKRDEACASPLGI